MQWQSQLANMPADVVKMTTVAMDHAMEEEAFLSPSPSFSPSQLDKTQPSERQADTDCLPHLHLRLSHRATHNAQRPLLPNAHPIASLPLSHPDKLVKKKKKALSGEDLSLPPALVGEQPNLRRHIPANPARRAAEVVSRRSVCCVHWKEADYFLAMVHWLCRLAKNEDVSHWANELGCYIKAKTLCFSSLSFFKTVTSPWGWAINMSTLKPLKSICPVALDK